LLGIYVGHSTIHSGNVILVYNPIMGHTTPQFHIVFNDYFQTIAPYFALASTTEVDALFDSLWINSQWHYNGDIPPEYLFPENIDFPTMDDDLGTTFEPSPDDQLATGHLKEILLNPICPGATHRTLTAPTTTETTGEPIVPPVQCLPYRLEKPLNLHSPAHTLCCENPLCLQPHLTQWGLEKPLNLLPTLLENP